MRRTYVSIVLLANNFDVVWVMKQVGHANSKMTLEVYAQLRQRARRENGAKFDARTQRPRADRYTSQNPPAAVDWVGDRVGNLRCTPSNRSKRGAGTATKSPYFQAKRQAAELRFEPRTPRKTILPARRSPVLN